MLGVLQMSSQMIFNHRHRSPVWVRTVAWVVWNIKPFLMPFFQAEIILHTCSLPHQSKYTYPSQNLHKDLAFSPLHRFQFRKTAQRESFPLLLCCGPSPHHSLMCLLKKTTTKPPASELIYEAPRIQSDYS